ncbi:MAG: class I SAM-dependent methyltransferase [Pyrinomonadaceae bacterium]|nr:class I SAM-dependent methyltransferase [Pyrinomonadaceae bacterium]
MNYSGTPMYILAPFVPTPADVVERMLQLGAVTSQDIVYDLGCGDGRVIIAAAKKYGARGIGFDIEPYRVTESQSNAQAAGVEQLVTFKHQDAMTVDLSDATVVMVYLVHWSTEKLRPLIAKTARAGTRIISHNFGMGDWTPITTERFTDEGGNPRTLHLWIAGNT